MKHILLAFAITIAFFAIVVGFVWLTIHQALLFWIIVFVAGWIMAWIGVHEIL